MLNWYIYKEVTWFDEKIFKASSIIVLATSFQTFVALKLFSKSWWIWRLSKVTLLPNILGREIEFSSSCYKTTFRGSQCRRAVNSKNLHLFTQAYFSSNRTKWLSSKATRFESFSDVIFSKIFQYERKSMEAILLINNETLVCLFSGKIEEQGSEFSKCIEFGEEKSNSIVLWKNEKSKIFRENNLQRTLVI